MILVVGEASIFICIRAEEFVRPTWLMLIRILSVDGFDFSERHGHKESEE